MEENYSLEDDFLIAERPPSGIAGWRGGWIAGNGSEGTRPAPLPAGPVPERLNVKSVFIETPHGPAINCTSLFGFIFAFFVQTRWPQHSGILCKQIFPLSPFQGLDNIRHWNIRWQMEIAAFFRL